LLATCLAALPAAAEDAKVAAAVLRVEHPRPLPISRLDLPPDDLGLAGARLATADNNTTGRFMGQQFTLVELAVPPEEAVAALEQLIADGVRFVATLASGPMRPPVPCSTWHLPQLALNSFLPA
jgi:hypothetical protein